jgi:hypothetical protein
MLIFKTRMLIGNLEIARPCAVSKPGTLSSYHKPGDNQNHPFKRPEIIPSGQPQVNSGNSFIGKLPVIAVFEF